MNYLIEIRSFNLKPGTREEFRRLYLDRALPLLKRWNFDVVAHGTSLHDENTYYVIRRYDSLAQREEKRWRRLITAATTGGRARVRRCWR